VAILSGIILNKLLQIEKSRISVRKSLEASTIDGALATIFSNVTTGVLLGNFLIDLGATTAEIGMLTSIPMLVNLLQPLGAVLGDRMHSRYQYGMWIFLPSRLIWLLLLAGIIWGSSDRSLLIYITLGAVLISNILASLGSAAWMSWLAMLVPERLRGRYYSIRNVVSSLVSLISLPVAALIVSHWSGGAIAGYGLVLSIGIIFGLLSLGCQKLMIDINPQFEDGHHQKIPASLFTDLIAPLKQPNLVIFLIYYALWGFAVNLSTPFFNLYMLENLKVDVTWVTLFNSLYSGASMLMILVWGQVSDRLGNRFLLIFVGMAIAITPLFWLLTDRAFIQAHLELWLAAFYVILGGIWAAIDLSTNNIQISIAPIQDRATFFAIAAAVIGVSGALGTTAGSFLAEYASYEGAFGVFGLSALFRLAALIPLLFVRESNSLNSESLN
jgi:MFS family permease